MGCWTSLKHKACRAHALPRAERWILLRAWANLLVVDVALRLLPFRVVQALLSRGGRSRVSCDDADIQCLIERFGYLVSIAARIHLYPMSCLRQSLVLQRLLAGQGIPSDLRFGVQKDAEGVAAHAWLEYKGRPIGRQTGTARQFVSLKAGR
jgi:hypothetical protein